jgi:hypothetical protein
MCMFFFDLYFYAQHTNVCYVCMLDSRRFSHRHVLWRGEGRKNIFCMFFFHFIVFKYINLRQVYVLRILSVLHVCMYMYICIYAPILFIYFRVFFLFCKSILRIHGVENERKGGASFLCFEFTEK